MEKYDLLIIGADRGGYVAALEATKTGNEGTCCR